MKLTGKLVRIIGGKEWELWREGSGYAGLQRALREFEGREVTVEFVETGEVDGGQMREGEPELGVGFLDVSEGVKEALRRAGYGYLEDVRRATDRELLAVAGIGRVTLRSIREAIR